MRDTIFLDNAGTTQPYAEVNRCIYDSLHDDYFNASAGSHLSHVVKDKILASKAVLGRFLSIPSDRIFFTSCATESNNWVMNTAVRNKKGKILVSQGEHPSIFNSAKALINKGYDVEFVPLTANGQVDYDKLTEMVDMTTALVSIMHVNNETGAVNDLSRISKIVKKQSHALLHSDGVQAFMKVNTNLNYYGVDYYTISAHKICGPKGIGALYVKNGISLPPFLLGGEQENGMRAGTENTPYIVGFAKACELYFERLDKAKLATFWDKMRIELCKISDTVVNAIENNNKHILSVSFAGIKAEILQSMLQDDGIIIGLGSACSTKHRDNRALSSMGLSQKQIDGSVRISFCNTLEDEDCEFVIKKIEQNVNKLRGVIL